MLLTGEKYVGFKDIRPAAEHHYLIIPKNHVRSVNELTEGDIPMIREMEQKALTVRIPEEENLKFP